VPYQGAHIAKGDKDENIISMRPRNWQEIKTNGSIHQNKANDYQRQNVFKTTANTACTEKKRTITESSLCVLCGETSAFIKPATKNPKRVMPAIAVKA